jgi:hypothetical protein
MAADFCLQSRGQLDMCANDVGARGEDKTPNGVFCRVVDI